MDYLQTRNRRMEMVPDRLVLTGSRSIRERPSSDIHLLTTTLLCPVLASFIAFLTATAYADAHDRRQRATALSPSQDRPLWFCP